jgi:hypothetical protein
MLGNKITNKSKMHGLRKKTCGQKNDWLFHQNNTIIVKICQILQSLNIIFYSIQGQIR